MSDPERLDDEDKHIKYSPVIGWLSGSLVVIPGVPEAAGATLHEAIGGDSKATISFHGTGIQVFGVSPPGAVPTASYTLDNSPIDSDPRSPPSGPLDVLLFSKQGLEQKAHELIIAVNAPQQYFLNYVLVSVADTKTSDSSPTLSSDTSESTSTATLTSSPSTGPTTASVALSTNAPTSDDSSSTTPVPGLPSKTPSEASSTPGVVTVTKYNSSSTRDPTSSIPAAASTASSSDANASARGGLSQEPHHTNTAAIVGGVLGVLLVIALVVIYAMIRRRRKSRAELRFPDETYTWRDGKDDAGAWNEPSFPEPTPLSDTPHQSTFAPSQLSYETSAPVPVAPHAPYSNPMVPDYPPLQPHQISPDPFRQPRHPALSRDQDAYATSAMT